MSDSLGKYWDASCNPLRTKAGGYHCTKVSEACLHCWAEAINMRFGDKKPYDSAPAEIVFDEKPFLKLARMRKPKRVFLCDMTDIAHPGVPDDLIRRVWEWMRGLPQHTFMVLTKRPQRLRDLLLKWDWNIRDVYDQRPLPNVWIGATVESPEYEYRIRDLPGIPAAFYWVSHEPALGPIDWTPYLVPKRIKEGYAQVLDGLPESIKPISIPRRLQLRPGLDWVVGGGETGPGARPTHPDVFRQDRDQCAEADVAFFLKHLGEWQSEFDTEEELGEMSRLADEGKIRSIDVGGTTFFRVGKRKAGRLLDGVEHNELPQ